MKKDRSNRPLISVIVPVYNVERYLDKCVSSLVGQTLESLEIILVNDGSPDGSPAKCREWAKRDSRIIVLDKENGGLSSARNAGLEVCTGRYVAFVDSDDYVHPELYERLSERALAEGYDFVSSETRVVPDHEFRGEVLPEGPLPEKKLDAREIYGIALTDNFNNLCAKIYRRELFDGVRFKPGTAYEDVEIVERLFKKCAKAAFLDFEGYFYFYNPNGISKRRNLKNRYARFTFFLRNRNIAREVRPDLLALCEKRAFRTAAGLLFWNCLDQELPQDAQECVERYVCEVLPRAPWGADKLRALLALKAPGLCCAVLRFFAKWR